MENMNLIKELPTREELNDLLEILSGITISDVTYTDNTIYLKPGLIIDSISKLETAGYQVNARKDGTSYEIVKEGKIVGEIYPN